MASGVKVDDACKTVFTEMKLGHKYRYVIYGLTEDLTKIVVMTKADPSSTYEAFVEELKEAEKLEQCRYAVFDVEYQTKDGRPQNKILLFMWSPEKAKIKQRMTYSSSKDALKKALGEGIAKEVQANDHGDLAWDNIMEIIQRTER